MNRSMWAVLMIAATTAAIVAFDLWALEADVPTISNVIRAAGVNWPWLAPVVGLGLLLLWLHLFWRR